MRRSRIENAKHHEVLTHVELGAAAILADERIDGRRFQIVAMLHGDEFRLTRWIEDARGSWRAGQALTFPTTALPELDWLSRRAPLKSSTEGSVDENVRIGDIVRPRGGGARMEITGITTLGIAWCVWTVNGVSHAEPFKVDELCLAQTLLSK